MMLLATVLLVANTIRVAAFSRRRETGIMRLVGASNFYIQLPFLLEAALAAAGRRAGRHRAAGAAQGRAGRRGAHAELPVHQLRRLGRGGPRCR